MASQLQPTTDQPDAYAVVNNWSSDHIAAALLGREPARVHTTIGQLPQRIALLALDLVVPANVDQVRPEKIIEIRERYGAEFRAFGLAVDQAAADMKEPEGPRGPIDVLWAWQAARAGTRRPQCRGGDDPGRARDVPERYGT